MSTVGKPLLLGGGRTYAHALLALAHGMHEEQQRPQIEKRHPPVRGVVMVRVVPNPTMLEPKFVAEASWEA